MNRTPDRAVTMLRQPSSNISTGSTTPDNATYIWAALAPWHSKLRWPDERQATACRPVLRQRGCTLFRHSLVIDPWGEVLLDMGKSEELGFAAY